MYWKSGRYALMMFCFWSSCATAFHDPETEHWFSSVQRTRLADGSVLTEYIARTPATNSGGVWLQTTYIPRFTCSPLSSIKISKDHLWSHRIGGDSNFAIELIIDGKPNLLSVNLDSVADTVELNFQGNYQRRIDLQNRIDQGTLGSVAIDQYLTVEFSLLGSLKTQKLAKMNCLDHKATPINAPVTVQAKNP